MTDALLYSTDIQEQLSRAYVQAVAASAGYTTAVPTVDKDSIDLIISAGGEMRPQIGIQLKATINLVKDGEAFSFPLSIKNHNDLRRPSQTPRLLVVLDMPKDASEWMSVSVNELMVRRCAFWISLRGEAESENTTSVTVKLPQANVFDVAALKHLMNLSRSGALT